MKITEKVSQKVNPIENKEQAIATLNEMLDVFSKTLKTEVYQTWNDFAFKALAEPKQAFENALLKIVNELGDYNKQEAEFTVVSDKYRRALETFRTNSEQEQEFVSEKVFQSYLDKMTNAVDFLRTQNLSPTEKAVQTHAKRVLERNIILKKFRVAVSKYIKQEEARISDISKYFFKRRLFQTIYDEAASNPTVTNFDAAMKEIMAFNSKSYVAQKYMSGMKKNLNKLTYQARDNAIEQGAVLDLQRLNEIGDLVVDIKGKTLSETYQRVLKKAQKRDKALAKQTKNEKEVFTQIQLDI